MNIPQEESEKLERGVLAEEFLKSDYWHKLVKPALDNAINILSDIRGLEGADIEIEVEARKLALGLLEEFRGLLEHGYDIDAKFAQKFINQKKREGNLYKVRE